MPSDRTLAQIREEIRVERAQLDQARTALTADVRRTGQIAGSVLAAGWRLESGDGTVTLEVPDNLAADVDLHTGDGHIDLDMPVTTIGKLHQGEVRGKLNGGGNLLVIHTGDGSIRLRKG